MPVPNKKLNSIQIIQKLQREIATLKAAQIATLRIQQELRESEQRWQLVLQGTNEGIWDWNLKTDELFFSHRWKEMLGYQNEDLSNHLDTWKMLLHPQDRERVMDTVQAHLERQTSHYAVEFRLKCKDGTYKWILSRGQALWDQQGNPIRMIGTHSNISERKQEQ
ncbi:MAG: PAS domain-containing protein, partial [cyanobacterium endosymbiont of Rhopalodia yunnanensis]